MALYSFLVATLLSIAAAFLPFQPPPPSWGPHNWGVLGRATISMACNSSSFFDPSLGAEFGIVSYDWSNNKARWAQQRPMNDVELMLEQAAMTQALNPASKTFIYANLVKALPWLTYVREKLEDPQFSGYFLPFKPGGAFPNGSWHVPACDDNYDPPLCSPLYHDQQQTPQVPSAANPTPDGACVGTCDCGRGVPCGEYLWDHRNESMRAWLVSTLTGGSGMGSGVISGFFIDDFWCSDQLNLSCTDPVQGATEIDRFQQSDMGLSDKDVTDLTSGWLETMTQAQSAILGAGGFTWSLMSGGENADASPRMVGPDAASCLRELRASCGNPSSPWASAPLLFGLHPGTNATLASLQQDLAAFLLMRGPWAWLGYGVWGMSWPAGTSFISPNGTAAPVPHEFYIDYGEPAGPCAETASGVFERALTKAHVRLDCNAWIGNITLG